MLPQVMQTGVLTTLRRLFAFSQVSECNHDVTPTDVTVVSV